jgi:uncharacterized membrane protein
MAVTQKEQADRRNMKNGHISCLRPVLEYKEACLSRLIFIFKAFLFPSTLFCGAAGVFRGRIRGIPWIWTDIWTGGGSLLLNLLFLFHLR